MLGKMMKSLRVQKGITQESLALSLDVKQSTISSWEIERTSPTLEQLVKLAEIFGVTVDQLLGMSEDETAERSTVAKLSKELFVAEGRSLPDLLEFLTDYVPNNKEAKLELAQFLRGMSQNDFLAVAKVVVAVARSRV